MSSLTYIFFQTNGKSFRGHFSFLPGAVAGWRSFLGMMYVGKSEFKWRRGFLDQSKQDIFVLLKHSVLALQGTCFRLVISKNTVWELNFTMYYFYGIKFNFRSGFGAPTLPWQYSTGLTNKYLFLLIFLWKQGFRVYITYMEMKYFHF